MKKQFCTISLCLLVSAGAAFAGSCPVTKSTAPTTITATTQSAPCQLSKEDQRKKIEEKMKKDREQLFTDLNLTKEQRCKVDELDKKNIEEAKPLFEAVRAEKRKMHELKANNASEAEIAKQKQALKTAKKALKKHFMASRKAFEAILTKEQKAKFEELKAKKKAERKEFEKKYGKPHHKKGECKKGCPIPPPGNEPPMGPSSAKCPCGCGK